MGLPSSLCSPALCRDSHVLLVQPINPRAPVLPKCNQADPWPCQSNHPALLSIICNALIRTTEGKDSFCSLSLFSAPNPLLVSLFFSPPSLAYSTLEPSRGNIKVQK